MRNQTRDLVLIAAMTAILEVAKHVLGALPNVEAVTLLLIVYTKCLGMKRTLVTVYLFALIETLIYGFGLWSISYLYVWTIAVLLVKVVRPEGKLMNASFAATFGLLFGLLCSFSVWAVSGIQAAFSWWIAGIPYDLIHAFGNFFMVFLLYEPLLGILSKLKQLYRF